MSLTPNEIALELAQIGRQINQATEDLRIQDEEAVRARRRFEVEYAREFLSAEGPMEVKKQKAILATSDKKLDAEISDQKLRAIRSRLQELRDRLEIGRSLGATIRSEWAATSSNIGGGV